MQGFDVRTAINDPSVIFTLRECSALDLDKAQYKLRKAKDPVKIFESGTNGLFYWYIVGTGTRHYGVIRFGPFAKCECKDFEFSRSACKHVAACQPPPVCDLCCINEVAREGETCPVCLETHGYQVVERPGLRMVVRKGR